MGHTAARRIVPDVNDNQASLTRLVTIDPKSGGVAVLDEPRSQVSESLEIDQKKSISPLASARFATHDLVTK